MRPFKELRDKMSPEAQERAAARAKQMLESLGSNRHRYEEALSHVRPEEERYKFPFYEPKGTFDLIKHVVDFTTGEHKTTTYQAYFSERGMICVRAKYGHTPLAHGLRPESLGQYQWRVTKNRSWAQMWTIGEAEHIALFYKLVAKHLSYRSYMTFPHPTALRWPDNDAIENKLMEYGYPSNTKNAARAGWNACYKFYQKLLENLHRGKHPLKLSEEVTTPSIGSLFPVENVKKKD